MQITAEILLNAYRGGYFPMSDSRLSKEIYWYSPEKRGIIALEEFHIPRSLAKFMKNCDYEVRFNTDFRSVILQCADVRNQSRQDTWINDQIIELYCELSSLGYAFSVETWQAGALIGGLYGVSIAKAFFGESMFSLKTNASKFALVHLIAKLKSKNYKLLDTQYINQHLLQFGVKEIDKSLYLKLLADAL